MNPLDKLREVLGVAGGSLKKVLGIGDQGAQSMSFPTTSQQLAKSTEISQREEAQGLYKSQDNSLLRSPLLGSLKSAIGANYEDNQVTAYNEGMKAGGPRMAARFGNNPASSLTNIIGGISGESGAIKKVAGNKIKNLVANQLDNTGFNPVNFKTAEDYVKAQATKDGVATRFGEISKDGAYFSKQVDGFENKNYFNAKTGNIKNAQYDISKANIVKSDTREALNVLKEALKDTNNTPQDIIRLKREIDSANEYGGKAIIDWRLNDEIPSVVKSAKKLGYDGINVIETGDISKPTSLFIWNTNKIKELKTKSQLISEWNKANGVNSLSKPGFSKTGLLAGTAITIAPIAYLANVLGVKDKSNLANVLDIKEPENIEQENTIGQYLGQDEVTIGDAIANTEGFAGNEEAFRAFLKNTAPGRLKEPDRNKYGDAGKFGWVVGFTKDTYNGIVEKAKKGDKRYIELLKKIDLDSSAESAKKSAVELLKFKNTIFDSSGKPMGMKKENLEDAYVTVYNASGPGEIQARNNWKQNSGL